MTHKNSDESRDLEKKSGRSNRYRTRIHEHLSNLPPGKGLTDRDLMEVLGVTDPNLVRPEVTRLKQQGMISEIGKVICKRTNRSVRVVTAISRPLPPRDQLKKETPLTAMRKDRDHWRDKYNNLCDKVNEASEGFNEAAYKRSERPREGVEDLLKAVREAVWTPE